MAVNFQELPHPGIRSLVPYKPGKPIEELAREKGISNIIKMGSNENPLGCSPLALSALHHITPREVSIYPSPANHPLMTKLAQKLNIDQNQLFVSNGSDYIYTMLLYSFALHQPKHILLHDYTFSTYAAQANALNIPIRSVAIHHDWQVNIKALIEACNHETSIIFLANPNNPTGVLISPQDIKNLLEGIPESTLLVLDEAYYEFAAAQYQANSIEWVAEHPNLVITRTFSKIYGLAGLRLGYAIAHPSIIEILQRVQLPFTVNQAALAAAYAALDDEDFLRASLHMTEEGMAQLIKGFQQLDLEFIPSACNFLTFNCKEDGSTLYNYLLDKGIIVRTLHPYKMNDYIRVTVGTKEQNTRFLNALSSYYLQEKRK